MSKSTLDTIRFEMDGTPIFNRIAFAVPREYAKDFYARCKKEVRSPHQALHAIFVLGMEQWKGTTGTSEEGQAVDYSSRSSHESTERVRDSSRHP